MASKSNIRSIRFTDELYELIDRQAGDTFTQKLENLVTRCVWELPKKEAELKAIQDQIKRERESLQSLVRAKETFTRNLNSLDYYMRNLEREANRAFKALEGIEGGNNNA